MSRYKLQVDVKLDKALIKAVTKMATEAGTHAALDHLATVSQKQVPIDTGALKASCSVRVGAGGASGVVSYDTPYAIIQHEKTGYSHPGGGKAKYLEDPANDGGVQGQMRDLIAAEFSRRM